VKWLVGLSRAGRTSARRPPRLRSDRPTRRWQWIDDVASSAWTEAALGLGAEWGSAVLAVCRPPV